MSITEFLVELKHQFSLYTEDVLNKESLTLDQRRLNILNQSLVYAYYKILIDYFDTSITGDGNFFTQAEARIVIDKLNNIMKTYLYTDFS